MRRRDVRLRDGLASRTQDEGVLALHFAVAAVGDLERVRAVLLYRHGPSSTQIRWSAIQFAGDRLVVVRLLEGDAVAVYLDGKDSGVLRFSECGFFPVARDAISARSFFRCGGDGVWASVRRSDVDGPGHFLAIRRYLDLCLAQW